MCAATVSQARQYHEDNLQPSEMQECCVHAYQTLIPIHLSERPESLPCHAAKQLHEQEYQTVMSLVQNLL